MYIMLSEMFLWTGPRGRRAFGIDAQFAQASKTLAANQGLYNGFLAAGLVWGLVASDPTGFAAKVFFLTCVAVAGVYGAVTVSRRILFVQTVPALLAMGLVLAAHRAGPNRRRRAVSEAGRRAWAVCFPITHAPALSTVRERGRGRRAAR